MCIYFKLSKNYIFKNYEEITKIKNIETEKINNINSKITVYTLGTHMKRSLYNNLSSLKQNNYNYKLLALGEKWGGWRWRIEQYIKCLEDHILNIGQDNVVVFIDGYDAFSCKDEKGLYEDFLKFNSNIVVGMEKGVKFTNIYGDITNWWKYKNIKQHKYKHATCNAGFIIGRPKQLLELYNWIYENKYDDDQIGLRNYINKFPHKIEADFESKIIFNKIPVDNKIVTKTPYFMHFPGHVNNPRNILFKNCEEENKKYIKDYYSVYPIEMSNNNVDIFLILSTIIITTGFIAVLKK